MARKIHEACSEMTMSLRRNLSRSKYGCQTSGPRRFWSLAFRVLMQPLMSGANAKSSRVCEMRPSAVMGSGKSEVRSPRAEGRPKSDLRIPTCSWEATDRRAQSKRGLPRRTSDFGLRTSDLSSSYREHQEQK